MENLSHPNPPRIKILPLNVIPTKQSRVRGGLDMFAGMAVGAAIFIGSILIGVICFFLLF